MQTARKKKKGFLFGILSYAFLLSRMKGLWVVGGRGMMQGKTVSKFTKKFTLRFGSVALDYSPRSLSTSTFLKVFFTVRSAADDPGHFERLHVTLNFLFRFYRSTLTLRHLEFNKFFLFVGIQPLICRILPFVEFINPF